MRGIRTIPALPVRDTDTAVAFYRDRLGFAVAHQHTGFARMVRDAAEVHLWESGDEEWRDRDGLPDRPVQSGAESFIAGTASCRIEVDDVDAGYAEMSEAGVLHYADPGGPTDTDFGTREFAISDLDNNLIVFFQAQE